MSGSETKSGKPYLAARRSIERYESGQFKEMKKRSPEMARVGKTLPPIGKKLPGDRITITVRGEQAEGNGTREREFTATFTGPDAYTFGDKPTYRDFFRKLGYPHHVIDLFEDGDYELDVSYVA